MCGKTEVTVLSAVGNQPLVGPIPGSLVNGLPVLSKAVALQSGIRVLVGYLILALQSGISYALFQGNGYFAVNGILPSETILLRVICDWSILMMY